jgi:cyclase
VRDGVVVKGVQFRNHRVVGDIESLAARYRDEGADELVFYDITASPDGRTVDRAWVSRVAAVIDIPFCVAGGIRSVADAEDVLNKGADKVSVNSPALENPGLITQLAHRFGSQCVVLGIDSRASGDDYDVYQYTGDPDKTAAAQRRTTEWILEAQDRGIGEVVLNCMNQDGVRQGYDVQQLSTARTVCNVPLIASGGAGAVEHFRDVFLEADVDGALAASVFHSAEIDIRDLKAYLLSLHTLEQVIIDRLENPDVKSYTSSLAASGNKHIAQKVGEEAVELALASVAGDRHETLNEAADLVYHLLVLLNQQGLQLADVVQTLASRHAK